MENLKDTTALMESNDYVERFRAEYWQTKIRYEKLKHYNNRIEAYKGTDEEPTHDCPLELLRKQERTMFKYLTQLEERAAIERIIL